MSPPGSDQIPCAGGLPRRAKSTRLPSHTTAPTPTIGRGGYSRSDLSSAISLLEKDEKTGLRATRRPVYQKSRKPAGGYQG
jgi:hypothetical protein